MVRRVTKAIGKGFSIMFLVTFIPFFLLSFVANDPAEVVLRVRAITPTVQNIAQMRQELGLNDPFFVRYLKWLSHAIQGDFGTSYTTGKSILAMIGHAFPYTLLLTVVTIVLIFLNCFILSILAVNYANHWFEKTLRVLSFILNAIPPFWLGLLLISFFAVRLDWVPTGGYSGMVSVILPAIALSLVYSSSYIRLIRQELLQNKTMPYVMYYQVRGFSKKAISRHLLKNSLRSSIVSIGISIPKLIAGSAIIESVFAWPGMGLLCIQAIQTRDLPLLQAYIVIMALFFIISSYAIGLLNQWLDPRLRQQGA